VTLTFGLRRSTLNDAYVLWLWRNDAETRRVSLQNAPIEWLEHISWLQERLGDPSSLVLLAESAKGQPVGSVRFDTRDAWQTARLSFVLAPEARGQGLGRPLVVEGVRYLRASHPTTAIYADVDTVNARSLRVFRGAGWTEQVSEPRAVRFWLRDGIGRA